MHDHMKTANLWLNETSGDFDTFVALVRQEVSPQDVSLAKEIVQNIPIYDGAFVHTSALDKKRRASLLNEWTNIFLNGSGVLVVRNAMTNMDVLDRATAIFETIIEEEKALGHGDHFAKPGANNRIWNSLQKHCLYDPHNYAQYISSYAIALGAESWLGRGYQMTAQVNRVNPGGTAQTPHRDYHLGFMPPSRTLDFPAHIHRMSPFLTLQGALAHCEMPLESGPTMFLPFSQHVLEGYLMFERTDIQQYFAKNYVQLPLNKGDLVYFNPAVMHCAGDNSSEDIYRMANLLQVSSPFGRAMETVNRLEMSKAIYPALLDLKASNILSEGEIQNSIAACAEGYSFPTNLDRDPPVGGISPKTQAQILIDGLDESTEPTTINMHLDDLNYRQLS